MALRLRRNTWDLVVIGGGIAGLTAARHAARLGMVTALLEPQPAFGGQIATVNELDDWPAVDGTSGVELAASLAGQARNEGVYIIDQNALALSYERGTLLRVDADQAPLHAQRVLVASGARLRALGVPGEDRLRGKGVSQCADCDGYFFRGEDVVVVGGGDSAVQEALILARTCRSVTLVVRSRLKARRSYRDEAAKTTNVAFIWDSTVEEILGASAVEGVRVLNLRTGERSELACSGVFPFVGVTPNTEYLPQTIERDANGCVMTDESLRTSMRGVYATGAVRAGYLGDLIHAAGEGAAAAATIARELPLTYV